MSAASSPPRSAVVLHPDTAGRKLPYYVEPAADEALISWLLRLATGMGIPMQTLLEEGFGIERRDARARWWPRPHPWLLKRISDKTGVNVSQLRGMTLTSWASQHLHDEASERFSHRHFPTVDPGQDPLRFAACAQCVKADASPYLRLAWMIGWTAVCPDHATVLITHCARCRTKLRAPRYSWARPFSPLTCASCEKEASFEKMYAHPSVVRLQQALLKGKREGLVELDNMGSLSWKKMVVLADVLIGMYWTEPHRKHKQVFNAQFDQALSVGVRTPAKVRYVGLAQLAWLTADWPTGSGAQLGRNLLVQWLTGERGQYGRRVGNLGLTWANPLHPGHKVVEPEIRERFRQLVNAVRGLR